MANKDKLIDKRNIFLYGKHLVLKILTEDDIFNSNWYGWFNDEEATANMQKHYFPNSLENQLEFFNSLKRETNKIQLGIIPNGENVIKGIVSLQNIDYINSNAEISIIIGEPEFRKLIIAQEAMQLMIDHAFFTLNLHKIYGGYIETLKDWGLFLRKRFCFCDEGLLRKHVFINGKYMNVFNIGLLKDDYISHINNSSFGVKNPSILT